MSTDDIFDGKAAESYNEFSIPTPVSIYGKSKLGRGRVCKDHCSQIFNHPQFLGIWKGRKFCDLAFAGGKKIQGIFRGRGSVRLPDQRQRAGEGDLPSFNGRRLRIISCSLPGSMQTAGNLQKKSLLFAGESSKIVPVSGAKKAEDGRPAYAVLDNLMLRLEGMELPKNWEEALNEYMMER